MSEKLILFQMLGALQDPLLPFADIIRTHFRLKAKSLAAQLERWLQEDDGGTTDRNGAGNVGVSNFGPSPGGVRNGMKRNVDDLLALIAKLTLNGEAAAAKGSNA